MIDKRTKKQRKSSRKERKTLLLKGRVVNYPVGDFLVRLKNASLAEKRVVEVESTKLISAVSKTLKKTGYLDEVVVDGRKLRVRLSYRKKEPVIMDIRLVSRPGLRVYMGVDELEKTRGPAFYILSTSKGVMASDEAVKKRLGGEVIAEIL